MKFRVEARLNMPVEAYWAERDSAAFRSLLMKALKLGKMEFADVWKQDGVYYVKLVTQPELGNWVPKSLRKFLEGPNGIEYTDVLRYDPALLPASGPYVLTAQTTPSFFSEKVDINTKLTINADGPGWCRQVLEGDVSVRLMGMGRMVENVIVESLKNTYAVLPQVVERWKSVREELLRQPDGYLSVTAGQPLPLNSPNQLHSSQSLDAAVAVPAELPEQCTEGTAVMTYRAKRPPQLDVTATAAVPEDVVHSLQQPYADTPASGGLYTASSAKRKWESIASDSETPHSPSGKLQDTGTAFHRQSDTPWLDARSVWDHDLDAAGTDLEADHTAATSRRSSAMSMSLDAAPSYLTICSNSNSQPGWQRVSLHLQDLAGNNKDTLHEGGEQCLEPQGDLYCSCGDCAVCLQDVQTANAILSDRHTMLTQLPDHASECCEVQLPTSSHAIEAASHSSEVVKHQVAAHVHRVGNVLLDRCKQPFARKHGYSPLLGSDEGHLLATPVSIKDPPGPPPAARAMQPLELDAIDFTGFPQLVPGSEGPPQPKGHHRRHSSMTSMYKGAAPKLEPGRWSAFNDNYSHWNQVWDELHVAEAPVPNTAARLLHVTALLHSWGLIKFVDPVTGKTITSSQKSANRTMNTSEPHMQQSQSGMRVRVRGRWFMRCFGCYMDHEQLMAAQADKQQSRTENQKARLLLGSCALEGR